jgi:hypothetical protein
MSDETEKKTKAWFVRHEGLPMGPLPGAKIRHLLLEGEITLDDQISVDRKHWVRMVEVPEVVPLPMRAEAGDAEAKEVLKHRQQSDASSLANENRIPWVAIVVVLILISGIAGLAVWVGMPEAADTPQCQAKPAPGVNWRNCLLAGVDAGSASLAGANLNSAVLRNARLSATNMSGADMRYTDLSGADLRFADLRGSVLLGANLQSADLRGSNLANTDLRYADLSGSLIENANWENANLGSVIWQDGATCAENSVGRCLKTGP